MSFRARALASPWLFRGYLALGLAAVGAYHLCSGATAVALYGAIGVYTIAASLFGATRGAALPRLVLTGGLTLLVAGDLEWYVADLLGHTPGTPSAADALYLLAYPTLAAGLVVLSRGRGRANLLDSVTVTVALATVLWSPLFASFRASSGDPLSERLTLGAYPVWDLLLFLLAARFALGRALRAAWRAQLTLAFVFLFLGDLFWAASADTYALGGWVDSTWLVAYLLLGASALHRSVREEAPTAATSQFVVRRRFLVLALPVAILPIALVGEVLFGHTPTFVDALLTAGLVLLLLVRLGGVVRVLDVSRDRFRRLFDDAPAGLATIAPDGRIVSVNAALCAIARTTEEDMVGRDFRDFIQTEDSAAAGGRLAEMLTSGKAMPPVERRLRAVDGSDVWTVISFSVLTGDGQPHLLAHVQDVTEARRLQCELAERNERLVRADRLKDELISVVSHDLRTPLTSIMGYLELALDEEAEGELSDERREYLGVARRNCERLHRLVEDLLFVSRVKSGRAGLDLERLDVGRIARDAVENALPVASAAGIGLDSNCDADVEATVDGHRVAEAIENLLTNAIKFTPAGGRVEVRVTSGEDEVRIRVSDTGVGIEAEDLEHLFDRFFRASSAEAIPGAGLGLSIVKAIVEAHGGGVDVESAPGRGTSFVLRLPRRAAVPAATTA